MGPLASDRYRRSRQGALERKNPKDAVQDAPVVDTRNATRLVRMATDASNRQNRTTGISEITRHPLTGHAAGTPKSTLMTRKRSHARSSVKGPTSPTAHLSRVSVI